MMKSKNDRNSFILGETNKSTKRFSLQEETKIAKELGGKKTPMSGALRGFGTDIIIDKRTAVDLKSVKSKTKQLIVTEDMLHKLELDAGSKTPMLLINFTGNNRKLYHTKWAVVPLEEYNELTKNRNRHS